MIKKVNNIDYMCRRRRIKRIENKNFTISIWIWFFPDSGMVNLIYNNIIYFLLIGLVWFVAIARFPLEYWLFFINVFTLLRSIRLLGLFAWLLVKLMLFLYNFHIFVLLFRALYWQILLFLQLKHLFLFLSNHFLLVFRLI